MVVVKFVLHPLPRQNLWSGTLMHLLVNGR